MEDPPATEEPLHKAWTSRPRLTKDRSMSSRLQWYEPPRRPYSVRELLADRSVNFTGSALACIGAPMLGLASAQAGDSFGKQVGFWCHGIGLITMLTCSAFYHYWAWQWKYSHLLLSLDHIGISTMIMGCYFPICFHIHAFGVLIFVCVLGVAGYIIEIVKFMRPGWFGTGGPGKLSKLEVIQIVRYLVMGWACAPVLPEIIKTMPAPALWLTVVGGLLYTGGVAVFVQANLEFHTAIWHLVVLIASVCFFLSNYIFLVGVAD